MSLLPRVHLVSLADDPEQARNSFFAYNVFRESSEVPLHKIQTLPISLFLLLLLWSPLPANADVAPDAPNLFWVGYPVPCIVAAILLSLSITLAGLWFLRRNRTTVSK
jgi:hypothetical protein